MGDNNKFSFYLTEEDIEKLDKIRSQNCERRTRSNMVAILIEREFADMNQKEVVSKKG